MKTAVLRMGTQHSLRPVALCAFLLLACPAVILGADYKAPVPYTAMYNQLVVGLGWQQVYEITRATELQRAPADLDTTDLLQLESVNRRCQAQLIRLHWYEGKLHWVEYLQFDAGGVTYQERGNPDPIGERLVERLTGVARRYASHWEELTASIAREGSPALQAKAKRMADSLRQQLEESRDKRDR